MSTTQEILLSRLKQLPGTARAKTLLQLCSEPSFWGDEEENAIIQELLELNPSTNNNPAGLLQAKYLSRKGDTAAAWQVITDLLVQAGKLNDLQQTALLKIEQAKLQLKKSEFAEALVTAMQVNSALGDDNLKVDALNVIAEAMEGLGQNQDALAFVNEALALSSRLKYAEGEALSYNILGQLYDELGDYKKAIENHLAAHQIWERTGNRYGIATAHKGMGNAYWKQSNHPEALKSYLLSLRLNEAVANKQGMGGCYNNIANIYNNLGSYDEAFNYYNRALQLFEETGFKLGESAASYGIGVAHYEQGRFEEALQYHLRALQIREAAQSEQAIAASYNYIGNIYAAMQNFELALNYQLQGLEIAQKRGGLRYIGNSLSSIGRSYLGLGNYAEAEPYLLKALQTGTEIGEKFIVRESLFALIKLCRDKKDFEQALQYFETYHNVNNEIAGEKTQLAMGKLNYQYGIEIKEKEAQLLQDKKEEAIRHAHKLEISNNELKQFAHVAAHDLREPLRMITSFMSLLEKSLGSSLNAEQRKFLDFALDGSARMGDLIQNMLRLAKVDAAPAIELISLDSVIEEIKINLLALMKEKHAVVIYQPNFSILADRTQILQLFQNIIGNGIKYNEDAEPTVLINYAQANNLLEISISDNGIGVPADYREKAFHIFERVPTQKSYSGSGLGLAICKKIVDNMQGKIWMEDTNGGGTTFKITLPAALVGNG